MPGTTNFKTFNPNCNNQESDSTYLADASRTGGVVTGQVFSSLLANKVFYQSSIFITAFAQMLAAKGYSPNDGSASPSSALANLQTVLANVTTASEIATVVRTTDIVVSVSAGGNTGGSVMLGPLFGNLRVQWGVTAVLSSSGLNTISYGFSWPSPPMVFAIPNQTAGGTPVAQQWYVGNCYDSNFQIYWVGSGSTKFFWLAVGPGA